MGNGRGILITLKVQTLKPCWVGSSWEYIQAGNVAQQPGRVTHSSTRGKMYRVSIAQRMRSTTISSYFQRANNEFRSFGFFSCRT